MKNLNVKTGDTVLVITGKDAGKQGKVLSTSPKAGRITVAGVNMISKHQKARKAQEKSSIVKKEGTIDVSNVMVVCPACGKPTRIKHTIVDGKSVRACKCGATLDKKYVKETKKTAKKTTEAKAETAEKTTAKKTTAKKSADKKVVATASAKDTKTTAVRKSAQRGV
ncbi:MAG: 50S ribosomal protein L24 [Clostridia bacterium]|nr:50S ribosomal protein L24 [Clostridia bacterium]